MDTLKKNWLNRTLLGFSLASFFNDFCHEMTTAILPNFIELLVGASASSVLGIVSGVSRAFQSIAQLFSGLISDRIVHHKPLLVIGYSITAIFVCLIGTAYHVWQVVLYRTIAWTGRGLREPPRDAWLTRVVDQKDYGKAFGFHRAFDSLGALMGPVVAFFAINYVDVRTIFLIALIPGILSVVAIMFVPAKEEEQKPSYVRVRFIEQFKALPSTFLYFILTRLVFGLAFFDVTLIILRAHQALMGHTASYSMAIGSSILLYAFFNVMRAVSEYGIGTLSDYVNRKNLLAVCGFGLFGLTSMMLAINPSSTWAWALIFGVAAISVAAVTVLEKARSADLLPHNLQATGQGVLQATKGIGFLLSNGILGFVVSSAYASVGFVCAAALCLLAMVMLLIKK